MAFANDHRIAHQSLMRAKSSAPLSGISLREFFISAVKQRLDAGPARGRQPLPAIGDQEHGPDLRLFTREEIDEAMFG